MKLMVSIFDAGLGCERRIHRNYYVVRPDGKGGHPGQWVGSGSLLCGLATPHPNETHPIVLGESKAISVYSLELG